MSHAALVSRPAHEYARPQGAEQASLLSMHIEATEALRGTYRTIPTSAHVAGGGEKSPPGGLMRHRAARKEQQRDARQRPLPARLSLGYKAAMDDDHLPQRVTGG